MREVTDHKVNGLNEALTINALEPDAGGAPTGYQIYVPDSVPLAPGTTVYQLLSFQSKPIQSPADYNGITNEALLAVVIDRLRCFQAGPFACRENAIALTKAQEALMWLQQRTRDRMQRGVEGTLAK